MIYQILTKYKTLFSAKTDGAGNYEHVIELRELKAIVRRSYLVPLNLRSQVEHELNEMLRDGIIERSVSS